MDPDLKEKKRRIDMKEFIKMQKKQMAHAKQSHEQADFLIDAIKQNKTDQFSSKFCEMKPEMAFTFLNTENQLRQSSLSIMVAQESWVQFLQIVSQWSCKDREYLKQKLSSSNSNQFQNKSIEDKFIKFLRTLLAKVSKQEHLESLPKIIQLFIKDQNYFKIFGQKVLSLDLVLTISPEDSINYILETFFLPIAQGYGYEKDVKDTKNYLLMKSKEAVWKDKKFLQKLENPQLLILKELNYTFMHDLFIQKDEEMIYQIIKAIQINEGEEKPNTQIVKDMIFTTYSNSGQTPLDLMLKKWNYASIKKFMGATQNWQQVNFSTNSLNQVIGNNLLDQEQVEELMKALISNTYRKRGYSEVVINQKVNSSGRVIKAINGDSITIFDKNKLLMAIDNNHSFPLLGYLNRFQSKCKLQIIEQLFIKCLERKNVKRLLFSTLKLFGDEKKDFAKSEGIKQIFQTIISYHQPLLESMSKLRHGDLLSFFIDKMFINCFNVALWMKSNDQYHGYIANKHFLQIYAHHQENLEENEINRKVLQKITTLKQNEKTMQKFDFFLKLADSFYRYKRLREGQQWLIVQVRNWLRNHFQQTSPKETKTQKPYSQCLNGIFSLEEIKQLGYTCPQKKIDPKHTPRYQTNKSYSDFERILADPEIKDMLISPEYKRYLQQRYFGLEVSEDDILKKLVKLSQIGFNGFVKTIRTFYNYKEEDKYEQILSKLEEIPAKAILKTMIKNKNDKKDKQAKKGKSQTRSMSLFQACYCVSNEDIESAIQFLLQASQEFVSEVGEKMKQQNGNFVKNGLLLGKILKNQKLNGLIKIEEDFVRKGLTQNVKQLKNRVRRCPQQSNQHIETAIRYFEEAKSLKLNELERISFNQLNKEIQKYLLMHNQSTINLQKVYQSFSIGEILGLKNNILDFNYMTTVHKGKQLEFYRGRKKLAMEKQLAELINQQKEGQEKQKQLSEEEKRKYYEEKHKQSLNKFRGQICFLKRVLFIHSIDKEKDCVERFINFLKNVSLELFAQFLDELFLHTATDYHSLLKHLNQEEKIMLTLRHMLSSQHIDKSKRDRDLKVIFKFHPQLLAPPIFALTDHTSYIKVHIVKGETKKMVDHLEYLVQCQDKQFQIYLQFLQTYFVPHASQQQLSDKFASVFKTLFDRQGWHRLSKLIKIIEWACSKDYNSQIVQIAFDYFYKNRQRAKKYQQKEQYQKILIQFFSLLETHPPKQFNNSLFEATFVLDAEKACSIMKPKEIQLLTFAKCLSSNPSHVKKLAGINIKEDSFPQQVKNVLYDNFPLSTYAVSQFNSKPYLVDLLKEDIRIYTLWCSKIKNAEELNEYHQQLNRKKAAVFLVNEIIQRHEQIYDEEEIKKLCPQIFCQSSYTSIKQILPKYLDIYFKNYDHIKNISNLAPSLIMELIDGEYVKDIYFGEIIKSGKIEVVQHFVKKFQIELNSSKISQIQTNLLKGKLLLQMLITFDNQDYVTEFIKTFSVFDIYTSERFEQISGQILQTIACFRSTNVLKYLLVWLQNKNGALSFFWQCENKGIKGNNVFLPQEVAISNNFYEYKFLQMQSSGKILPSYEQTKTEEENTQKIFKFSSRFMMISRPQDYQFIPEMKRRLLLLQALEQSLVNSKERGMYEKVIFPAVFSLRVGKLNRNQLGIFKLILSVISKKFDAKDESGPQWKDKNEQDVYSALLQIKSNKQIKLSEQTLFKLCPNQYKVVKTLLDKFQIQLVESNRIVFKYPLNQLNQEIFIHNPTLFLQQASDQVKNNALNYLKPIFIHIKLLENQYPQLVSHIIQSLFFYQDTFPFKQSYSDVLYRNLLNLCALSKTEGNGKVMETVMKYQQGMDISSEQNLFFKLAFHLNQYRGELQYNNFCWSKIEEQLEEYEKFNGKMGVTGKYDFKIKQQGQKTIKFVETEKQFEQITAGLPDYLKIMTVLRNTLLFHSEQKILEDNLKNIYKKVHIKLGQSMIVNEKEDQCLDLTIPYEIQKYNIPAFNVQKVQINEEIEKLSILRKLTQEGQFQLFNCLSKLKFSYDIDSFRAIQSLAALKKCVTSNEMTNDGIYLLKDEGQKLQWKTSPDSMINCYSLSDVYGPIPINDDTDKNKVLECLTFFNFLNLPDQKIKIKYSNGEDLQNGAAKLIADIKEYLRYFKFEINDDQDQNDKPYEFNTTICMSCSNQNKVKLHTDEFFAYNIVTFIELFAKVGRELTYLFQNTATIKFQILTILKMVEQKINDFKTGMDVIVFIRNFLYDRANMEMIKAVLFMIIEDANNMMKVVKGILIIYQQDENVKLQEGQKLYKINNEMSVHKFDYAIEDMLFKIFIKTCKTQATAPDIDIESTNLVSRKQFLDTIFSSTEFLTDYFLEKPQLTGQTVRISTSLSKKLNTTVNCSINYKSLYSFIEKYKQKVAIKDIDQYLSELRRYILTNYQKFMNNYIASKKVALDHQILMFNKFFSIKNDCPVQDVFKSQKMIFNTVLPANKGLKEIRGLTGQIKSDKESTNIKNMFLIQIYKSSFSSILREGMSFILGSKAANKPPTVIQLQKKQDVDKVNIVDLAYLLLITNKVPTNDEINHSKIIRIFVTDLNENVYQVDDDVKKKLLSLPQDSDDRNLADLVPVTQPNIILTFCSQLAGRGEDQDDKEHKYLQMEINEKMKFKIMPKSDKKINGINYLKTDLGFNNSMTAFSQFVSKIIKNNIQIQLQVPQDANFLNVNEHVKFFLYDFQNCLNLIFNQPMRNHWLETSMSVEKGIEVRQNVILKLKKQFFKYDKLNIICISEGKSSIQISGKTISIYISTIENGEGIPSKVMVEMIARDMIQKIYEDNANLKDCVEYSKNEGLLVNILDTLCYAKHQLSTVNKVISLVKETQNLCSDISLPDSIKFNLMPSTKSTLRVEGNILYLDMGVQSSIRPFFPSHEILSFLINQNQELPQSITLTKYLANSNTIQIVNYHQVNCMRILLVGLQKSQVRDVEFSHDPNNTARATLAWEQQDGFSRYYLIQEYNSSFNISMNYFWQVPDLANMLIEQKNNGIINTKYSTVLSSPKPINLNESTSNVKISRHNEDKPQNLTLLQTNGHIRMLSHQIMIFTIQSPISCSLNFNFDCYSVFNTQIRKVSLSIASNKTIKQENTKFIQLNFRGKTIKAKSALEAHNVNKNLEFFKQPAEKAVMNEDKKEKPQKNVESMVYIVNDNSRRYLTRAGQDRIDVINICDDDGNPINFTGELKVFFKHLNLSEYIQPEINIDGVKVQLKWRPTIRGPYEVFVNGIRLNPEYQIGVCAAYADLGNSKIQLPKKLQLCYSQESEVTLQLKDSFGNIYTQLQQNHIGDPLILQMESSSLKGALKMKNEHINKYGFKKVRFSIEDPTGDQQKDIQLKVLFNKQEMANFMIKIKGQALKQRRKNVEKDIEANSKRYYKDITISRNNFMEGLFKVAQMSLAVNFSIKFTGEQGIDAGGLKRQFYDMIGNQFKKTTNPFFKPTSIQMNEYFIDPEILKNKKKEEYMELLGKYLANSFLNGYLIGVNFSPVFVKLLYGDDVSFEDLLAVIPKEEAQRYKYLLNADQSQFQDLQLYFTAITNKRKGIQVDLIENGKEVQVTKANVNQYLQKLAKVLLVDRFEKVMESFREGFNSVIKIDIVRKWIRPDQFWCLTAGVKEITPEDVIQYTQFQGGHELQNGWLRRYLQESSHEILEGFLKFASGSSSIDYDKTSKVVARFQRQGDNPKKLPIAHTCWKEIIIPAYKTYDIMKTLLNAAFLYCSEGFGFG